MKRNLFLMLLLLSALSVVGISAQSPAGNQTVTNADLEKYRSRRLAAEKDYLENYARLGFPSPAELERRNADAREEMEKLAARLRQERLEAERISLQQSALSGAGAAEAYPQSPAYYPPSGGYFVTGYDVFGRPFRRWRPFVGTRSLDGRPYWAVPNPVTPRRLQGGARWLPVKPR